LPHHHLDSVSVLGKASKAMPGAVGGEVGAAGVTQAAKRRCSADVLAGGGP